MVPVGTQWDRRVTSSMAVGAAVTRKLTGLPVTRWLEPCCTALVQRLARQYRASTGGWFKTNSPVLPVVHRWYYPVVPGGAPVVLHAAGIIWRSTAGPRRHGSWLALARQRRGLVQTQPPSVANRMVPVLAGTAVHVRLVCGTRPVVVRGCTERTRGVRGVSAGSH